MFGVEIKVRQLYSAGKKNKTAGIYYQEGCQITSFIIKRVSILQAEYNTMWVGKRVNLGFVGPKVYAERYQLSQEQILHRTLVPLPQEVLSDWQVRKGKLLSYRTTFGNRIKAHDQGYGYHIIVFGDGCVFQHE
jgi:hypothetical protein